MDLWLTGVAFGGRVDLGNGGDAEALLEARPDLRAQPVAESDAHLVRVRIRVRVRARVRVRVRVRDRVRVRVRVGLGLGMGLGLGGDQRR